MHSLFPDRVELAACPPALTMLRLAADQAKHPILPIRSRELCTAAELRSMARACLQLGALSGGCRMDLWQALNTRVTVRTFDDRPVPTNVVAKGVRAALRAPAYNHLWEWGFIQIHDRSLRTGLADAVGLEDVSDPDVLAAKFASLPAEARQIYLRALPLQRTMVLTAPGLLVPVYRPKRGERTPQGPADLNAHAAVWIAIGYMLLSLAEDGVYGCTIIPGRSAEARHLLGIPEDWEIATLLPFGYPRGRVVRNEHPSDVDAFLHADKFHGFSLSTTAEPMG